MLNFATKRNAVKTVVAVTANALMCQATEEVLETVTGADENSDTVHYTALGVGTALYFGRYHHSLMHAVDRVADWRVARKDEKNAEATA